MADKDHQPGPKWTSQLACGIDIIDGDHKTFFEMAQQLTDILNSKNPERDVIDSILMVLEEYVDGHFLREEMFLRHGPPREYREHKRQHDGFRKKVKMATAAWRSGDSGALETMPAAIAGWISEHILKVDQSYLSWVKAEDVDPRPLGLLVATRHPEGSPDRRKGGSS